MYQYRWIMYCKYIGKPLDHYYESNTGYISWVMNKWCEFGSSIGITENERHMYHDQFDKWLLENAPAEHCGSGEHILQQPQAKTGEVGCVK